MSTTYEITGTIHRIGETVVVKDTFRKREFVLSVQDGDYTQYIKLQVSQDRCSLLDRCAVGEEVTARFNLRGKPFTNKDGQEVFFTNLEAWRIDRGTSTVPERTPEQTAASFDDVPF